MIEARKKLASLAKGKKFAIVLSSVLVLAGYYLALYVGLPEDLVHLERQLSTGLHTAADIHWVFGLSGNAALTALALARLVHYAFVALICFCVAAVCPMGSIPMTKWGENSLQVYLVHLLILYGVNAAIGLDVAAEVLGVKTDIWDMFFPIVGGIVFTWVLAIPDSPNKWVTSLKSFVKNAVLVK